MPAAVAYFTIITHPTGCVSLLMYEIVCVLVLLFSKLYVVIILSKGAIKVYETAKLTMTSGLEPSQLSASVPCQLGLARR